MSANTLSRFERSTATREARWVKWTLLGVSLAFFGFFLLLPLVSVFAEALRKGFETYWQAIIEPDAISAIKLTLIAAAISLPLNLVFGVAASWAITNAK